LNITVKSTVPQSTLQTGESHYDTVVTGLPNADLKNVGLTLFTYPNNKRVAGNVFSTNNYLSGVVANLWSFALQPGDRPDRLPATISKAIARNYSRTMDIFEGDVSSNSIQF